MTEQQCVLVFDGQDDCVNLDKKPEHKVAKTITIEAWICASAQKGWAGILSNIFDTGLTESGYGLLLDGKSGIYFGVEPSSQGSAQMLYLSSGANTLNLNQWHHIAGTYDGQQMRVYVDGVEKATQAIASDSINYNNENDLLIGMYKDDDEFHAFAGKIAEVRLWDRTRSQDEIKADMNHRLTGNESGLVGYWPLNECSGNTVTDKTAKGNNGTINGATWVQEQLPFLSAKQTLEDRLIAHYLFDSNSQDTSGHNLHGTVYGATLTADRFGNPESAYQFDGVDDYIEVAHNDLLNLTDNFTISLWLKQEASHAAGYRLVDKTTAGVADGYNFDTYDGSTGQKLRFIGGTQNASANSIYSLNEWHHVAVVSSNGVATFYLDGRPDGSGNHGSSVKTNTLTLKIGAAHGSSCEFFKGPLDDIRIYNRALSEQEIKEIYQLPSSKKVEEKSQITVTPLVEITSIVYKGEVKRTQSDEYVEITNQGSKPADVSGWQIGSSVGRNKLFTFPAGTTLAAGQKVRVYTNEVHPETGGFSCNSKQSLWKDSGDEAKLLDAKGNLVSGLAYDSKGNFTKTKVGNEKASGATFDKCTTTTKTWTKELVQEHAKAAVMVEMYTLPFYLTVLSSIKDKKYPGYSSILSICIEEMLHMQLAANLCIALDTQPSFTAPKYDGTPIPYLDPKNPTTGHHKLINVKLDSLNETTLDLMLDIETPSGLEEERHPEDGTRATIHRSEDTLEEKWNMEYHTTPQYPYNSIGEMYEALVTGIKVVGENQFSWKTTNQQALWPKPGSKYVEPFKQIIASFEDAENAIKTISLQGEGTTSDEGSYAIPPNYRLVDDDFDSGSLSEYSHYERLLDIRNKVKTLDNKFPEVYTTTDSSSSKEQQDALQALQSRFASLLIDLDSMWNQGKDPNGHDIDFWGDMCNLLPSAEDCWKAGVVPKWS